MKISRIIRSNRKTLALRVTKEAEIVVRAPRHVPNFFISRFVDKNSKWIEKRINEVSAQKQLKKKFIDGEKFLFLGEKYLLVIKKQKEFLVLSENKFFLGNNVDDAKKVFESWYKAEAKKYIFFRIEEISAKYGFKYNKLRITSAKTRWGSCSNKKNISFSWRLILTPKEVIDYVILHELTHLKHMNHSKVFWSDVERLCPNYKKHKTWLKEANKRDMFFT